MCLITNAWQYCWRVFCPCCTSEKENVCNVQRDINAIVLFVWKQLSVQQKRQYWIKKNCITLSKTDWHLSQHCMENLLWWLVCIQNATELDNVRQWNSGTTLLQGSMESYWRTNVTWFSNEAHFDLTHYRAHTYTRIATWVKGFDNKHFLHHLLWHLVTQFYNAKSKKLLPLCRMFCEIFILYV